MINKEQFIKDYSFFTKINENKIRSYLEDNSIKTLIEHPETLNPTPNQLKNINNLMKLNKLYDLLSKYEEYKFEKTIDMVTFLNSQYENKFEREYFVAVYLDKENKLLGVETTSKGSLDVSIALPRDVLKKAIHYDSDRIVLSHNHPSGSISPSPEDNNATNRIMQAAQTLDIKIIDHIIIGRNDYWSFNEQAGISHPYNIEKTKSNIHTNIYNNDRKQLIDRLSKVTKIPKKTLQDVLKDSSVKDFILDPHEYLVNPKEIEKINLLKNIRDVYFLSLYEKVHQIGSPSNVKDYIDSAYSNNDKIDIVMYLNTKNEVIESKIIPINLTNKEEYQFIMKNALAYDCSRYMLVNKDSSNTVPLICNPADPRINKITEFEHKSELMGVKLLDKLEIGSNRLNSFKTNGILSEAPIIYIENKKNKSPMSERFAAAKEAAASRNENQKPSITKNKER